MPTERLRINEMFAFVAENEEGEGVLGVMTPEGLMPLVGADMARVESLRGYAQDTAKATGKTIRLLRFTQRVEVEEIEP